MTRRCRSARRFCGLVVRRRNSLLVALALASPAAARTDPPGWTQPIAPVHLIGNIYYVGTAGLASYLIRTPAGAILIDATMQENVPAILANIRRVGVQPRDVKWILVSHAHFDHAAGDAAMKRATGARLAAGAGDAAALESGTPPGETNYGVIRFPPVKVDRRLTDGDRVTLGGVTLTAIATPGHTPGCMSYTMSVGDAGHRQRVVFPCSVSVAGNKLFANRRYPRIAEDYRRSLTRLERTPADVVLPAHPELADVLGRARSGTLVAPDLLPRLATAARADFDREWQRQGRIAR